MYNLLVTADEEAWNRNPGSIDITRFGEYTAGGLKAQYKSLDEEAKRYLSSIPTIFAYEQMHDKPSRVGRIKKFIQTSEKDIKFEYEFMKEIDPIDQSKMVDLSWELDINSWELNRTHWAIKDVDIMPILAIHGLATKPVNWNYKAMAHPIQQVTVAPTVFSLPLEEPRTDLVSVMMPFGAEFSNVYASIRSASNRAGFDCQRADDIWENSSIIQDVFSLIYRSTVVVVDLSKYNPNVLYETGIAHTLGRPVVPIANSSEKLPFDLAHHRTLGYLPNSEGLSVLESKLERRLSFFLKNGEVIL